jgi:hypothetical protein
MNKQNSKLISIIVPCFNSGKTIKRTIESLKSQTWEEKEIIIVNDGSDDQETLDILNLFEGVLIINQKNLGLSAARNTGAYKAKGRFLLFLDSDDWIEDNTLELMFNFFEKNISISNNNFIFSDIILEGEVKKMVSKNYNFFEQLFLNQIPYSIFIEKNTWLLNNGYDENMRLGYEDWEFNIRLGAKSIFGKRLPIPLFHYSVCNTGMLISKSSKYHAQIWHYIKNKNSELYKPKNILKRWKLWRKEKSSYPLIIFFIWYVFLQILPNRINSVIFLLFRNFKWFFSRNRFLNQKQL